MMSLQTARILCFVALGATVLNGCTFAPLVPAAHLARTGDDDAARPQATSPRPDNAAKAEPEPDFHLGLPAEDDFDDSRATPDAEATKSLGNVLVDLETMKRERPDDYNKLKQLLDSAPDTIPPQYQQTFQDQLLAIAAHQSPASSLHTLPVTVEPAVALHSLLQPTTPVAAPPEYKPPAHSTSLASQEPPRSNVATHVGDIAPDSKSEDAGTTTSTEAPEQPEFHSGQWRDEITEALDALEAELIRGKHDRQAKARLESCRRLLHVVANHTEDAVLPIKELDEDEQEFWKHQLHGLLIALDADQKHASSRRAALALRDLRTASHHLANISTLDLRNLTFCTKVNSYGEFTEFGSYTFRPAEEVILYVEIDNFAAHPKGDRYETELHGSYHITDDTGGRVANVVLPIDRQVSNNRRRDYYIPYLITMPADITSGSYRLQLAIEDVIGKKSNHASIDFRVR